MLLMRGSAQYTRQFLVHGAAVLIALGVSAFFDLIICICVPSGYGTSLLWSSGQISWLQSQRYRV